MVVMSGSRRFSPVESWNVAVFEAPAGTTTISAQASRAGGSPERAHRHLRLARGRATSSRDYTRGPHGARSFAGKQGLVLGVANKRSIAWAIARRLADEGAELAFTYQGERIESTVRRARGERLEPARHGLRRALRRRRGARLLGGGRGVRRWSRPPRALRGVRSSRGPRGPLHGHAARPLLDGRGRQRVLARRLREAAEPLMEARGGGSIVTMTYLGGERAVPSLQRHGRREGDARRLGALSRMGPRAEVDSRQRDLGRACTNARGEVDRRLHDDGGDVRAAGPAPPAHRGRRLRRRCARTSSPTMRRTSPARRSTSTPAITAWECDELVGKLDRLHGKLGEARGDRLQQLPPRARTRFHRCG